VRTYLLEGRWRRVVPQPAAIRQHLDPSVGIACPDDEVTGRAVPFGTHKAGDKTAGNTLAAQEQHHRRGNVLAVATVAVHHEIPDRGRGRVQGVRIVRHEVRPHGISLLRPCRPARALAATARKAAESGGSCR